MNDDYIKIDSTVQDIAKSLYLVQGMIILAANNYSEAYTDFSSHYMGNAEDANEIYINGLLSKLNSLAKFYGDSAYILDEIYESVSELEANMATKLR